MRLFLSMVKSAAFCELARRARDADVRRFPADAPSAPPAELRRAFADETKRTNADLYLPKSSPNNTFFPLPQKICTLQSNNPILLTALGGGGGEGRAKRDVSLEPRPKDWRRPLGRREGKSLSRLTSETCSGLTSRFARPSPSDGLRPT